MRILYLCHRIPYPPDKGDKIRAFHQVQSLSARHQIDLFTLADDAADMAHQSTLALYCRRLTVKRLDPRLARLRSVPYLFTRSPLTVPYFHSAELQRTVHKALATNSYDRIFVYCSAMAQYIDGVTGIPIVTDFVDVDSNKWKQYATFAPFPFSSVYKREARALRNYERRVSEHSSCVVVTTEREARLVREISASAHVEVIPNGVDTQHFRPPDRSAVPAASAIGFTGDMSYFPNEEAVTWFARTVLPLIRKALPQVQFLIVGRNPSHKVQKLGEIPGVEVTGFVPDVRPYLARIQVSVAPFAIAAGIQNKILEAMAYGLPVVGTARAVQGLSEKAGAAVEVANGAEEMAGKIVRLLLDPELARNRGLEGRRQVTEEYSWERSLGRLLEVVQEPLRASQSSHEKRCLHTCSKTKT
jgi:sugar transferase (PEP-CTERM/EpsH1 system associated)